MTQTGICIQEESINYFGKNIFFHHTDIESYSTLFNNVKEEKVIGEASTIYLYSKTSAEEIHNYNPDAKIIMMFREPVSFMHSLHSQYLSETTEDEPDFAKALDLDEQRRRHQSVPAGARSPSFLFYKARANYLEHIERYLKVFDKNRICIIIFEDFLKDNKKTLEKVLNFLQIKSNFTPAYRSVNTNKIVKYKFLYRCVQSPRLKLFFWKFLPPKIYYKMKRWADWIFLKYEKREPLHTELTNQLKREFLPDVITLNDLLNKENLIDRDLSEAWGYQ